MIKIEAATRLSAAEKPPAKVTVKHALAFLKTHGVDMAKLIENSQYAAKVKGSPDRGFRYSWHSVPNKVAALVIKKLTTKLGPSEKKSCYERTVGDERITVWLSNDGKDRQYNNCNSSVTYENLARMNNVGPVGSDGELRENRQPRSPR